MALKNLECACYYPNYYSNGDTGGSGGNQNYSNFSNHLFYSLFYMVTTKQQTAPNKDNQEEKVEPKTDKLQETKNKLLKEIASVGKKIDEVVEEDKKVAEKFIVNFKQKARE